MLYVARPAQARATTAAMSVGTMSEDMFPVMTCIITRVLARCEPVGVFSFHTMGTVALLIQGVFLSGTPLNSLITKYLYFL